MDNQPNIDTHAATLPLLIAQVVYYDDGDTSFVVKCPHCRRYHFHSYCDDDDAPSSPDCGGPPYRVIFGCDVPQLTQRQVYAHNDFAEGIEAAQRESELADRAAEAEAELRDQINASRAKSGLPPMTPESEAEAEAEAKRKNDEAIAAFMGLHRRARRGGLDVTPDELTMMIYDDPDAITAALARCPTEKLKPEVKLHDAMLHANINATEDALIESRLPVFQRGPDLVRPGYTLVDASHGRKVMAPSLVRLNAAGLTDVLSQGVIFYKLKKAKGGEEWKPVDPDPLITQALMSRYGIWQVPHVAGVISTPTMRPNGTVLRAPGYDPATRLYFLADENLHVPAIPPSPGREDAEAALALLVNLLDGFPLIGAVDRAVALSGLITPVLRAAMRVAPLHAFRAPAAGSGKSYLVDLASTIATGRLCPVSAANHSPEEIEKHLVGLLLAGFPIISMDNIDPSMTLGSGLLCQAVERPSVRVRALGRSDIHEINAVVTCFSTGNNLTISGDMTRRTLLATIDAKVERPELRRFASDPVQTVMADRGRYVAACLTIAKAYKAAGMPGRLAPIASYREWSDLVRSALVWLGEADAAESMETTRAEDPKLMGLKATISAMAEYFGLSVGLTAKEMAAKALAIDFESANRELKDALTTVAGDKSGQIDTARLGYWLKANAGRVINGMRIEKAGENRTGISQWQVVKAT